MNDRDIEIRRTYYNAAISAIVSLAKVITDSGEMEELGDLIFIIRETELKYRPNSNQTKLSLDEKGDKNKS